MSAAQQGQLDTTLQGPISGAAPAPDSADALVPLVVDLDGTLLKGDSLELMFLQLMLTSPFVAIRALCLLGRGRLAFKQAVAERAKLQLDPSLFRTEVVDAIEAARLTGRRIYLATAAPRELVHSVSDALPRFDGVFASGEEINLKGRDKANALLEQFGYRGFDYIGNSAVDIPVWKVARCALLAGAPDRQASRLKRQIPQLVQLDSGRRTLLTLMQAVRVHQWTKNALLFLPALAGHAFTLETFALLALAFVSFSAGASSVYIINDIIDLPHDRLHAHKRFRPIAAGNLSIVLGFLLSAALAALSLAIGWAVSSSFLLTLIFYFCATTAYSLYLKRKLMVDVIALAGLYGIRVLAGGVATGIPISHWLTAFCFCLFLSLALMKRSTELILSPPTASDRLQGRNYRRADLSMLHALTAASGFASVLVLSLYIDGSDVTMRYAHPDFLWGACVILIYWLGRAFLLTGRGEMRTDPVLFAATDRISQLSIAATGLIFLMAM